MSVPRIPFALMCEGVRPEPNGKANILGFYGVLPDASVLLSEINKPLQGLVFVTAARGPSDEVLLRGEILNPDETILISTKDEPFPGVAENQGAIAAFAFGLITFPQIGQYYLQVVINGETHYRQPFQVRLRD